uniref:Putative secreted protein n=1 Tax=Ixodes ricinus TaxID=34613 RepID=A0A147BIJ2_IXORI
MGKRSFGETQVVLWCLGASPTALTGVCRITEHSPSISAWRRRRSVPVVEAERADARFAVACRQLDSPRKASPAAS